MLDPIISLLATCATCNQTKLSADQPVVAACPAGQRSTPPASQANALSTPCVSPPEAAPESLRLRSRTIATPVVANQSQTILLSHANLASGAVAPESLVSVSWSNTRVLQLGSREQAVTQLQRQLQQLGFYAGATDGIYGPQTKAAVAQFQRSKGLQPDGVVGVNTWTALQTISRQPQSTRPSAPTPTPQTQTDRRAAPPLPSPPPVSAPASAPASPSPPQLPRQTEDSPQLPLKYLWVLGWAIIYGSGWVLILKDTVKELKGFHFFVIASQKASQQVKQQAVKQPRKVSKAAPKVVIHYPGNAQPSAATLQQAAIDPKSVQPVTAAATATAEITMSTDVNHSGNGYSKEYPNSDLSNNAKVEPFALDDPWQEENIEALPVQVLQVTLADAGQVQPLQNVFVIAPRPTHTRSRVKKPASIYQVQPTRQRIKTG